MPLEPDQYPPSSSQSCFATEARDELVGLDNAWDMRGSSSSKYRPFASDLSSQSRA